MGFGKKLLVTAGLIAAFKLVTGVAGHGDGFNDAAAAAEKTPEPTSIAQGDLVRAVIDNAFGICRDQAAQSSASDLSHTTDFINECVVTQIADKGSVSVSAAVDGAFQNCRDEVTADNSVLDVTHARSAINVCVLKRFTP